MRPKHLLLLLAFICTFCLLFVPLRICAQDTTNLSDIPGKQMHMLPWYIGRFNIEAGTFLSLNSTDLKIGSDGHSATLVDLEKDLGFKKATTTFLGKAQWRISRRSQFEFRYYNLARSSIYTLKKDIDFADTTFHINASINGYFNTRIFEFTYGYAVISQPRYELGVKLGVHLVSAKAGLYTDNNLGLGELSKSFTALRPMPDFGIWGGYSFGKRWAIQGSGGYFYADKGIKQFTVAHINIFTYNALLHYKVSEHVQLCGGYMGYFVKMNALIGSANGYLDWGYHGPTVKASFVFGNKG